MHRTQIGQLLAAILLFGLAVFALARFLRTDRGVSDKAFFYDLSQKKLFTGPRQAIPPIRGLDDDQEDAVRAVVISTTGDPKDRSSWKIAYLERYSDELKQQMEKAQATGNPPPMGRRLAQAHRFVRRENDTAWYPMSSDEAAAILAEWLAAGPNGGRAVICTP